MKDARAARGKRVWTAHAPVVIASLPMSDEVHTLEDSLETARQAQAPITIALGGRLDAPHEAYVIGRNGQTFELMVHGTRIALDVTQIVLILSIPKHKSQPPPPR